MIRRSHFYTVAGVACIAAGVLGACSATDDRNRAAPPAPSASIVLGPSTEPPATEPAEDGAVALPVPDDSDADCDKGDRRARDRDCGRYVAGRWVEWTWVARGLTRPPSGWSPASEPVVSVAPRPSTAPAAPAASSTPRRHGDDVRAPVPASSRTTASSGRRRS